MTIQDFECAACKFWLGNFEGSGQLKAASSGECRRFPPSRSATDDSQWQWPIVRHIDFCGEFVVSEEMALNDLVSGAALRDPVTGQELP
jgi:hypothetical protein